MKLVQVASAVLACVLSASGLCAADGLNWPGISASEPFLKEKWPAGIAMVWAKPGTGGDARDRRNWLEYPSAGDFLAGRQGQPASKSPDANTDLILPDAPDGQSYIVGFFNNEGYRFDPENEPPRITCRHVTIGKGAALDGGCGTSRGRNVFSSHPGLDAIMAISGNVTVKDGGCIYSALVFVGGRHTFFQIGKSPEPLGTRITVRKAPNASLTLLAGQYDLAQGVLVDSGRLVLGPTTHLRFNATVQARVSIGKMTPNGFQEITKADNREGYVYVRKGAALEMRAGSSIGRVKAPEAPAADMRIEGLLQIGRAGDARGEPAVIDLYVAEGDGGFLTQGGGLYIRPTAEVKNFGKLTITACDPNGPAAAKKGVSIFMEKVVNLGEVTIDYLRPGGIVARDPKAAQAALAKATFGQHCATRGAALYSKLDLIDFRGGMGTVEFVDGLKTDCEILFPLGGRLIVRSKGNRISQSFDIKSVSAVTIAGKQIQYNPRRALTAAEQEMRKIDALWGDVPGKGQVGKYGSYQWPKAPLLAWRRPGQSGSRFIGPNWLDESGVPCFESPMDLDPNIDVLVPEASKYYSITGFGPGGMSRPVPTRHVTVERNAQYGNSFNIRGNLWMKHASSLHGQQMGTFSNTGPNVHRFMRYDGKRMNIEGHEPDHLEVSAYRSIAQWGLYETGKGGTLELIGKIQASNDQSNITGEGTLIISENSFLTEGNRSAFAIMPEATLVLLQDARIGNEITIQLPDCRTSVWVAGTLMIGMPERPIRSDMLFPLAGVEKGKISRDPGEHVRSVGVSLLVGKHGRIVMYSADPAKARVIFKMHDSELAKQTGKQYGHPEGIVLDFAGKAELNGVVFDNVFEGGIMVSPEQKARWKNVFYGQHNLAAPDKLYWDMKN